MCICNDRSNQDRPVTFSITNPHSLINETRKKHGLPLLSRSFELDEAARNHATIMAKEDGLYYSDCSLPTYASQLSMNIAYSGSIIEAHHLMIETNYERKNILSKKFHSVGVGASLGPDGFYYVCYMFFRSKKWCNYIRKTRMLTDFSFTIASVSVWSKTLWDTFTCLLDYDTIGRSVFQYAVMTIWMLNHGFSDYAELSTNKSQKIIPLREVPTIVVDSCADWMDACYKFIFFVNKLIFHYFS